MVLVSETCEYERDMSLSCFSCDSLFLFFFSRFCFKAGFWRSPRVCACVHVLYA